MPCKTAWQRIRAIKFEVTNTGTFKIFWYYISVLSCEYVTGDVQVCMNKDCEGDDEICKQVGPDYR